MIIWNLLTRNTFIVIIEFIIIQIIIEIITAIIISKNIIIISNIIITTRQQLKVLTGRSPSRLLVTCQRSRLHRGQTSSFLNAFSNTNTEKYIHICTISKTIWRTPSTHQERQKLFTFHFVLGLMCIIPSILRATLKLCWLRILPKQIEKAKLE